MLGRVHDGYKTLYDLAKLALFAVAFGYIEAAVAHYLRLHYYPEGFTFQLKDIDRHVLLVEMGREAATIVVLFCITALTKGPVIRKSSTFIYIFGIWDITYYGAFYLFERWPSSLLDWDVLFLIPVPWFAPVIVPITISLLGIIGALMVQLYYDKFGQVKVDRKTLFLFILALGLWFTSFVIDSPGWTFPRNYQWVLFGTGIFLVAAGYGRILRNGRKGL